MKFNWFLHLMIIGAAAPGLINPAPVNAEHPSGWAVLFAPAKYTDLPAQPHQLEAVQQIAGQLEKADWPADQIKILSGSEATIQHLRAAIEHAADSMKKQEVLLVVVAARTSFDQSIHVWGAESDRASTSQLPVQELLETMSTAPTSKRLLAIDATIHTTVERQNAAPSINYSAAPLSLGEGQFVVINAAEELEARMDPAGAKVTPFIKALVDALGGYADDGEKQEIGLFSTLEYLRLYHQARELIPPVTQGAANSDYALVALKAREKPAYSAEQTQFRQKMAEILVHSAERTFIIEREVEMARMFLDRARSFAEEDSYRKRIDRLTDCLIAYEGGPKNVLAGLARAQSRNESLFLRLDAEAEQVVDPPGGTRTTRRIPAGAWVQIEKEQDGWLWVTKAMKGTLTNEKVSFEIHAIEPGWIQMAAFAPRPKTEGPLLVIQQLRHLNTPQP